MLCGTDNIQQNIPHIQSEYGEYSTYYCWSHITLLWIWIIFCSYVGSSWNIYWLSIVGNLLLNRCLSSMINEFTWTSWRAMHESTISLVIKLPSIRPIQHSFDIRSQVRAHWKTEKYEWRECQHIPIYMCRIWMCLNKQNMDISLSIF